MGNLVVRCRCLAFQDTCGWDKTLFCIHQNHSKTAFYCSVRRRKAPMVRVARSTFCRSGPSEEQLQRLEAAAFFILSGAGAYVQTYIHTCYNLLCYYDTMSHLCVNIYIHTIIDFSGHRQIDYIDQVRLDQIDRQLWLFSYMHKAQLWIQQIFSITYSDIYTVIINMHFYSSQITFNIPKESPCPFPLSDVFAGKNAR